MKRAFTLIELLVVLAIVIILAAILIPVLGMVLGKAEDLVTQERMRNIQRNVTQISVDGRPAGDVITEQLMGKRLQFVALQGIIDRMVIEHGYDFTNAPAMSGSVGVNQTPPNHDRQFIINHHLPPGIAAIRDEKIGISGRINQQTGWYAMKDDKVFGLISARASTLDYELVWMDFHEFTYEEPYLTGYGDARDGSLAYNVGNNGSRPRTGWFFHDDVWPWEGSGSPPQRHTWLFRRASPLDETVESTVDVLPDGIEETQWYYDEWPVLTERLDSEDLIQHAWPDADWDQEDPGSVAPIYEMPFGKPILARKDGLQREQYLMRDTSGDDLSVAQWSPMATMAILRLANVLPSEADYREGRSRESAWNDRQGNPLIIAASAWVAPRYDLDPTLDGDNPSHELDVEYTGQLHGGRDWLRNEFTRLYGSPVGTTFVIGALGKKRGIFGDDNPIDSHVSTWTGGGPITWTETEDAYVLRAAWLQIRELCKADEFLQEHISEPEWTDFTYGRKGKKFESLMSAPLYAQ